MAGHSAGHFKLDNVFLNVCVYIAKCQLHAATFCFAICTGGDVAEQEGNRHVVNHHCRAGLIVFRSAVWSCPAWQDILLKDRFGTYQDSQQASPHPCTLCFGVALSPWQREIPMHALGLPLFGDGLSVRVIVGHP